MTRKILTISLGIVALFAIASHSSSKQNELSDLMLENIEALASGEFGNTTHCVGLGSIDCPFSQEKVYWVMTGLAF